METEINPETDDTVSVSGPPVALGGGPASRGLKRDEKTFVFASDIEVPEDVAALVPDVAFESAGLLVFVAPYDECRRKWLAGDMPGVIPAGTEWETFVALLTEDMDVAWSPEHGFETRRSLPPCQRPTVQELLSPGEQTEQATATALVKLMIEENVCNMRESVLVAMSNSYDDHPMETRKHLVDVHLPALSRPVLGGEAKQAEIFSRAARATAMVTRDFEAFLDPEIIKKQRDVLRQEEVWQSRLNRKAEQAASDDPSVFMVTFIINRETVVVVDCTPGK